jgi:hypothetical protein
VIVANEVRRGRGARSGSVTGLAERVADTRKHDVARVAVVAQ